MITLAAVAEAVLLVLTICPDTEHDASFYRTICWEAALPISSMQACLYGKERLALRREWVKAHERATGKEVKVIGMACELESTIGPIHSRPLLEVP